MWCCFLRRHLDVQRSYVVLTIWACKTLRKKTRIWDVPTEAGSGHQSNTGYSQNCWWHLSLGERKNRTTSIHWPSPGLGETARKSTGERTADECTEAEIPSKRDQLCREHTYHRWTQTRLCESGGTYQFPCQVHTTFIRGKQTLKTTHMPRYCMAVERRSRTCISSDKVSAHNSSGIGLLELGHSNCAKWYISAWPRCSYPIREQTDR